MVKTRELPQQIRERIIALHEHTGKSSRNIAADLHVSQSTVVRTIKRYHETGSSESRARPGRPKVTTTRDDVAMSRLATVNPFITAGEIKQELPQSCHNVSVDTIKRRLRHHFKSPIRRAVRKPLITAKMKKQRLAFCQKYRHWSVEQWKQVMFSDESSFQMFQAPKPFVRRPPSASPFNPRYTSATVKHPPSVMVWGCFSHHGRGALTFLDVGVKMNTALYLSILEEKLEHFMTIASCTTFQQDSAPCHVSKRARAWFAENNIQLLDWPGNSPDLNPIENLWMIIKRKLAGKRFTNLAAFRTEITKVWCVEVSKEVCERLVESMPSRISAVLKNKGYPTKY